MRDRRSQIAAERKSKDRVLPSIAHPPDPPKRAIKLIEDHVVPLAWSSFAFLLQELQCNSIALLQDLECKPICSREKNPPQSGGAKKGGETSLSYSAWCSKRAE